MLNHKLLRPDGILVLEPDTPFESADFEVLAHEIDPYIAEHGKLSGVMIHAKKFPGWVNLEAFFAHMQFIQRYHRKVTRLAVVSDSGLLTELPRIADHLVHAEVKPFPKSEQEAALRWLRETATPANSEKDTRVS